MESHFSEWVAQEVHSSKHLVHIREEIFSIRFWASHAKQQTSTSYDKEYFQSELKLWEHSKDTAISKGKGRWSVTSEETKVSKCHLSLLA